MENKGLFKGFIFREKKTHTFYMYSGADFNDPAHKFMMMARYLPEKEEFRIFTINGYEMLKKKIDVK
jgi:hypothetical protein